MKIIFETLTKISNGISSIYFYNNEEKIIVDVSWQRACRVIIFLFYFSIERGGAMGDKYFVYF